MRSYSYYSQYTGNSRRRRLTRILLLCALAVSIFAAFLILGNLLNDRLEQAAPLLSLPAVYTAGTPSPAAVEEVYLYRQAANDEPAPSAVIGALSMETYPSADGLRAACALAAELYDGISIAPDPAAMPDAQTLRAIVSAAEENSLTPSAAISLSAGADSALAAAASLAEAGFHEILFTGAEAPDADETYALCSLYAALKEAAPAVTVGFSLAPAMFREADCAPLLETFAGYVDFLALDTTECGADSDRLTELCSSLYGSVRYYSLRILICGEAPQRAAQTEALREAGLSFLWQLDI